MKYNTNWNHRGHRETLWVLKKEFPFPSFARFYEFFAPLAPQREKVSPHPLITGETLAKALVEIPEVGEGVRLPEPEPIYKSS
jgi:pterin-4a-carbinolamine dehydratase